MLLWQKISICMFFLFFFCITGCYTPSAIPPTTTVMKSSIRPPEKKLDFYLSSEIKNQLERCYVRDWKYIVIHHSASDTGSAQEFDKYHRQTRGWENGLGYHFVIGNGKGSGDGEIEMGSRWKKQIDGAHAGIKEYNHYGVGICLVGNFNKNYPTQAQMKSLSALVEYLEERCHIPSDNVLMHRHCKQTECPGRNFPYYKLLANTFR
ncbi:MAG: N-acetylmuramoyl-L-alanine amidase [Planctomycetes bacterium]|nr:N-acetylmuramoyl-L-alanine amidase [Planctomycetota bacterium]